MNPSDPLARIRRGAVEIISESELAAKLTSKKPLVIKAGFDPTAADLHLGHTVLLRKLRQFQDLGHKVVFLIGDATALVGDPSGQSKMRKLMTEQEIEANAQTYFLQVRKILDVNRPGTLERQRNSEWFGSGKKVSFGLKELVGLTSKYTVARLIERDDFQKRLKAGQEVSLLELFYPLMQGYDSVMIGKLYGSCDVELGGTDQKFNLLVGRDLQRSYGQQPQVVITMPLLEGTDGVQKMSKSLGNHIGIAEPPGEMFGKLMSIPDSLIVKYFTLLTDKPSEEISALERQLAERAINPRDAKADLALTLVTMYHSTDAARAAKEEFFKVFSRREEPTDIPLIQQPSFKGGKGFPEEMIDLVDVLYDAGLVKSKNYARDLIRQGAIKIAGVKVTTALLKAQEVSGKVVQVGARTFARFPTFRNGSWDFS